MKEAGEACQAAERGDYWALRRRVNTLYIKRLMKKKNAAQKKGGQKKRETTSKKQQVCRFVGAKEWKEAAAALCAPGSDRTKDAAAETIVTFFPIQRRASEKPRPLSTNFYTATIRS